MTENKMTETEIMKALECCGKGGFGCTACPLFDYGDDAESCKRYLMNKSLALLNRKNAEIDDLIKENIRLERGLRKAIMPNGMTAVTLYEAEMRCAEMIAKHDAEIRAEAIKEFSEEAVLYAIQFYYDQIREFIREKTNLDPVYDFNPTDEELNQYVTILKEWHQDIAKEMGVEL